MSRKSSVRPAAHAPGSQDQAQFALDDLFELETVGARLLWPDSKAASVPESTDAVIDQTTRSSSIEFDFSHESPPKENVTLPKPKLEHQQVSSGKVTDKPKQQWHNFAITLGVYTHAANTSPVKMNQKVKWIQHKFPVTKQRINISNDLVHQLKARLFSIADEVRNDKTGGMTALFQAADANKQLALGISVYNHPAYGKGKFCVAKTDEDLKAFYNVVKDNLGSESAISFSMENPSRAVQAAVEERSLAHAVLKAKNIVNGKGDTPDDDLAHSDPVPKQKHCMNGLVAHQIALGNKVAKGYRIIKLDEPTKIMLLGFEHMTIWARELAAGTKGVTIDFPPNDIPGFKWESIKQSLVTTTPLLALKRVKASLEPAAPSVWGYAEMQGMHIRVDLEEALRLSQKSTINHFVDFVQVPDHDVDTVIEALEDHQIKSFFDFLFPKAMNAGDLERWGIPRGLGNRLMIGARRFYQHLIITEEAKIVMAKVVIPSSEEEGDYEVKVVSSKSK